MILLLTTRPRRTSVTEELDACGSVNVVRVPKPPVQRARPDTGSAPPRTVADPDWAYRRLRTLAAMIRDESVTAVVCADDDAHPIAWDLAEQHPGLPVFPDQSVAARVLSELRLRGTPPSRGAVHDLLDPLRPTLPPTPAHLYDRDRRRPMVVSIVQNHVTGDSRVQKVARSLAAAGYQSVLLAANAPESAEGDWYLIGDAAVLRFPIEAKLYRAQKDAPPGALLPRLVGYRSGETERAALLGLRRRVQSDGGAGLGTRIRSRVFAVRSEWYWRRKRSFQNAEQRRREHIRRAGFLASPWSRSDPERAYPLIADMEQVMGPALDLLKPHAIHLHDPMFLGMAMRARDRLARLGCEPKIVFDAHEWSRGVLRNHAYHAAALVRLEREHLSRVDDVITVSDEIAARMVEEFPLRTPPTVVENAPPAGVDDDYADVRSAVGVPPEAPLLAYAGGLAERRGVDDAVAALALLPEAHLVALSPAGLRWNQLRRSARSLGVADRLHRADYVPMDKVTSYLRTADVGLIPFRPHGNSQLGVPTKFREYLLAGLPIVATDLGATADRIRHTGVGELCADSDPSALAAAIAKVLDNPGSYTSRITADLLRVNSWEHQSRGLISVYERLIGPAEPVAAPTAKILIGATNSAGQAHEWARSLRNSGHDAASMELRVPGNHFTHRVDIAIPRAAVTGMDRRVQMLLNELVGRQTIVMESGRPLAAPEPGEVDARVQGFREARALRESGRNVALIFHGSDIRRPDIHIRTHRWSPFTLPQAAALADELRKRTRIAHEQLAAWDGPVMVSTPDLIHATPGAVWTPVVVDVDRFPFQERDRRGTDSRPPVVVHMPSRSVLKGSHLIDPVLRRLAGDGVIRYRRIERVPHESVPQILADCDIFIDQLGMGIFGVAPLEAMATGAAVITDPGPEALSVYGEEVPIVAVDPQTLETAVRELAADGDRRQHLATAGREFAVRHHDGRRSAAALVAALGL
jgi:glycosyltransferase involved in cell wall biosynthesis